MRQSQQKTCPHKIEAAGLSRFKRQIPQVALDSDFDWYFFFGNGKSIGLSILDERRRLDSRYSAIRFAEKLRTSRVSVAEAWTPISIATSFLLVLVFG